LTAVFYYCVVLLPCGALRGHVTYATPPFRNFMPQPCWNAQYDAGSVPSMNLI